MSRSGLSKARLGRVHDVLAGPVARGDVPGLVSLVSRRGETHVEAIGTAAVSESAPMQRAWTSPQPPDICVDFNTSVYAAIDD